MMYKTGGFALGNADQPYALMDRDGFVILDLISRDTLYQEFTDDGVLSFNRMWLDQEFLRTAYSTPRDKSTFSYYVFFDWKNRALYKKVVTRDEWDDFGLVWKNRYPYYRKGIELLNFERIKL